MANGQIMVNMKFQADTSQARQKMQELQNSLQQLQAITNKDLPMNQLSSGLENAKHAAAQLSVQLKNAFNQDTGKLDLSRFNQSLKQSGMSLEKYKTALMQAGPAGKQAFGQLATQIASADTHVIRISERLNKLGTTFANTIRWQISSSALMAVTSTISEAYQYAQDLNESLTDIRIVTGYSAKEMEKFADEANAAAKALSTTTTEYTKASLIYYQQGLTDKQVKERTDLTIKMANVTGQSAKQVSDQLTAVWNNFYNGTKSLEYYVDVMTALGAATASSSEEISEGLNKFAAVAETVGLSYEYAASALATVTATTRQSADVVGTAFKTLFARIQDLELGKTLDDGTTMGQYSQALAAVGINIKDTNDELKDMDQILNEMGAKWNTLSKDAQTALAQNVAGVRQYTQLIALMENWDFFKENLDTASNSLGTLNKQAEIYAEGWQAARDEVTAALEGIYESILDDKAFIGILKFFASLLENIHGVVDAFGGLYGVLALVATALMNIYKTSVMSGMQSMANSMMSTTKKGQATLQARRDEAYTQATSMEDESSPIGKLKNQNLRNSIDLEREYLQITQNISEENKEILRIQKDRLQTQNELAQAAIAEAEDAQKDANKQRLSLDKSYGTKIAKGVGKQQDIGGGKTATGISVQEYSRMGAQMGATQFAMEEISLGAPVYEENMHAFLGGAVDDKSLAKAGVAVDDISSKMQALGFGAEGTEDKLIELFGKETYQALEQYYNKIIETQQEIQKLSQLSVDERKPLDTSAEQAEMKKMNAGGRITKMRKKDPNNEEVKKYDELQKKVDSQTRSTKGLQKASKKLTTTTNQQTQAYNKQTKAIVKQAGGTKQAQQSVEAASKADQQRGKTLASATVETNKLNDATQRLKKSSQDLQGPVTFTQGLVEFSNMAMTAAMSLQMLRSMFEIWNDEDASFGDKILQTMMSLGMVIPMVTSAFDIQKNKIMQLMAQKLLMWAVDKGILATENAKQIAERLGITLDAAKAVSSGAVAAAEGAEAGATAGNTAAKGANTLATIAQTAANWALNASMGPVLIIMLLIVAAVAALVAIVWLVVKAFEAWKASTPEAKLAAAKEESARLSEELNKAKEAADNLRESIESYDSAITKIKTLKEGTEEWRQAIAEANDIARELIDENQEALAGKYSFNAETGLIEFEKGALDDLQNTADNKVINITGHKLRADNAVLAAENNVKTHELVHKDDMGAGAAIAGVAAMGIPVIGVLGPALAALSYSIEAVDNAAENQALQTLVQEYSKSNGNFAEALENLDSSTRAQIESLNMTDSELSALCAEMKANTDAMHENTKQLVHQVMNNEEKYADSKYKDFVADVAATDLDARSAALYEEKYKDMAGGLTDAEIQKQYAELMGWDANLVKNETGNKATYINEEGNEVQISDEQVRRALAQSQAQNEIAASTKDYVAKAEQLAQIEKSVIQSMGGTDALTMDNYEEYRRQVKATAMSQGLYFSGEEFDKFISKYGGNQRVGQELTLKNSLASLGNFDESTVKQFVSNLSDQLTDEQMQLAVDVAASAKSIDDFARQFEQAATKAFIESLDSSATQAKSILETSAESGSVSSESLTALSQDENFKAYLEEQGKTMLDVTASTYSQKMTLITNYYTKLKALEEDAMDTNIENYQQDLASYEAILQYKQAAEAYNADPHNTEALNTMNSLAATYNTIDFSAYMDMDVSSIKTKIKEINDSINDLEAREITLNMEWESTEAVETSLASISKLSQAFNQDMKKMGNSYTLTAEQLKQWGKQYPDLFSQAKVTSEGLVELDASVVDSYIAGQEAETEATIENNIAQLQSNYQELQNEREMLELERQMALGEVSLEQATAQQLMDIKQKLTQYYIDAGYDEEQATIAALQHMGISQEEYNSKTAELTAATAKDMINSANAGAEGTVKAFSTMGDKLKAIFSKLWEAITKLFSLDFEGAWAALQTSWQSIWTKVDPSAFVEKTGSETEKALQDGFNINIPAKFTATAEMPDLETAINTMYDEALTQIDNQMRSIETEIAYNKALLNQDLADYGTTDIEKDKAEELEEILERYHEITREIEMLERVTQRYSKQADRAFGQNKIKLLQKNIESTEKLLNKEKDLLKAQNVFLISDKQKVQELFNNQATFDKDGNINNYTALLQAAADALNHIKLTGSEDEIEAAEELFEKRQEALEQYEETLDLTKDKEQALIDRANELADLELEKIQYEIELEIKLQDNDIALLEHQLEYLQDSVIDTVQAIQKIGSITEKNLAKLETYKSGIRKTFMDSLSDEQLDMLLEQGDLSVLDNISLNDSQISQLEEYRDNLYDTYESLATFHEQVMEKVNAYFEAENEEAERLISKVEHLTSVLDTYKNVVDIVGKKALGMSDETLRSLGRAQVEAAQTQLQASKTQLDANREMLRAAQESRAKYADGSDEAKYWDEQIATIEDKVMELESNVNQAWTDTLQAAADDFANAVETTVSAFEEAMTGIYGTYDKMQEYFDQQSEISDRYVANYERVYQLSKLNRNIENSIDNADSVRAKEALRDLQKEINDLQESDKDLSAYELEHLQKKYDLRLAEIALEEAQNAKSQVRMTRDAEGNWSYVYTADQSNIDKAEQSYEDKLYETQKHSQEYIDEMQEYAIQAERDMVEAIANLRAEDFANADEYQAEVTRITEYYTDKRNYALGEMNKALSDSEKVYKEDWLAYEGYNGKKLTADGNWRTQFSQTALAQINGYTDIETARSTFETNTSKMIEQLTRDFSQWELDIKSTFNLAGQDFTNFGKEDGNMAKGVNEVKNKLGEINSALQSWKTDAQNGFQSIADAAAEKFDYFKEKLKPYKDYIDDLIGKINTIINYEAEKETVTDNGDDGESPPPGEVGDLSGLPETTETPKTTNTANTTPSSSVPSTTASNYNNGQYSREEVKKAQKFVGLSGADVDGYWGKQSAAAALGKNSTYTSLDKVIEAMNKYTFYPYAIGSTNNYNSNTWQKTTDAEYIIRSLSEVLQTKYVSSNHFAVLMKNGQSLLIDRGLEAQFKGLGIPIPYQYRPNAGQAVSILDREMLLFDTGGYTGSWDSSGRLAMLHQKELVLNADDTAKFLSAVEIVRDISRVIDLRAAAQQSALSAMYGATIAPMTQTLQQEVTIHAEFPNATNHSEIEAAFDNLINRASQFANRKN